MTECKCDPSEGLICAACAAGTTDWKTRAEAAEARAHELSVKYVCALRRAREMGEALGKIADECSTFPIEDGLAFRCESIARTAPQPPRAEPAVLPEECPRCGSLAPHLHPAVQCEGEVETCIDDFHLRPTPQNTPEYIALVHTKLAALASQQPDRHDEAFAHHDRLGEI
jgi:hypothetical protein